MDTEANMAQREMDGIRTLVEDGVIEYHIADWLDRSGLHTASLESIGYSNCEVIVRIGRVTIDMLIEAVESLRPYTYTERGMLNVVPIHVYIKTQEGRFHNIQRPPRPASRK